MKYGLVSACSFIIVQAKIEDKDIYGISWKATFVRAHPNAPCGFSRSFPGFHRCMVAEPEANAARLAFAQLCTPHPRRPVRICLIGANLSRYHQMLTLYAAEQEI
jgi:hypothetical protein